MKYYYDPQNRLPYKKRLRNRCIAIAVIVAACALIGSCIFKSGEPKTEPDGFVVNGNAPSAQSNTVIKVKVDSLKKDVIDSINNEALEAIKRKDDSLKRNLIGQAVVTTEAATDAAPEASNSASADTAANSIPENDLVDSVHIKNQKDVFLAEKIDNMLRRFRPMHSAILVSDSIAT